MSSARVPLLDLSRGAGEALPSPSEARSPLTPDRKVVAKWKSLAQKGKEVSDPWHEFRMEKECREEKAVRHLYNPRNKSWRVDEITVKMQDKPFAKGAMRECYRMKKLSTFLQHPDWKNASNYVAKRYMKEEDREAYFEDVRLQMDAKLWGEEYTKKNPPKKVDFLQTYVIEMKGREGTPLFCVEHWIEGKYIKYNSNSGYVSDVQRLTPQAFSHFTFERSVHQLIVVDVQGVGDLYTDPQIHTATAKEYGEANLGPKGMALFFSSHICSPLCEHLGLTQFDLSEAELERVRSSKWSQAQTSQTVVSSSASQSSMGKKKDEAELGVGVETVGQALRRLSIELILSQLVEGPTAPRVPETPLTPPNREGFEYGDDGWDYGRSRSEPAAAGCDGGGREDTATKQETEARLHGDVIQGGTSTTVARARQQLSRLAEEEREGMQVLGQVHYEMARYNAVGRFSEPDRTPDWDSAMFHLEKAGACGLLEALEVLSKIYLQIPQEEFSELRVPDTAGNQCIGFDYTVRAAEAGSVVAMVRVAEGLESGQGLGVAAEGMPVKQRRRSWREAAEWYQRALNMDSADAGQPAYVLLAKLGELYLKGGHGLEKDPSAAGDYFTQAGDAAMAAMKGKMANKYYMQAEEAWAECD